MSAVRLLIAKHPEGVSTVDSAGMLPIHYAFGLQTWEVVRHEVVQLLVNSHGGAHSGLDVADHEGNTLLHRLAVAADDRTASTNPPHALIPSWRRCCMT